MHLQDADRFLMLGIQLKSMKDAVKDLLNTTDYADFGYNQYVIFMYF